MHIADSLFLIFLFAAVFASYKTSKLTFTGALTGGLVAVGIYSGAGYAGIFMLAAFFALSVFATSWRREYKRALVPGKQHQQKRNAGQVLANGGVAAILGLLAYYLPVYQVFFSVMLASALAAATADTLSSELGTIYGRRFYNIISFKPDEKGRDGVISLEGTLIGIAGAAVIALVYSAGFKWDLSFWIIIIAGTAGNLADSILGATLERKGYLTNNWVNFSNTAIAAWIAWVIMP